MADFDDPNLVDQVCFSLKLGDYFRGQNRARINQMLNGFPPYSEQEVEENGIVVNFNDLSGTTLTHDARSQFYGAFLRPGKFFTANTDMGPKHKRMDHSLTVTEQANRIMGRSLPYFECFRSKFALVVAHGIGPAAWENSEVWCPDPVGIEDVLVPGKTLLTMKNLPFFAIYRSFTARELIRLTRKISNPDPGWNMELVDRCVQWVDKESVQMMGSTWPEVWSPEKMAERVKGDGGYYPGDTAATVDCFDFYFWDDDGDTSGWRRRIILDSWGAPAQSGIGADGMPHATMTRRSSDKLIESDKEKKGFLYTSGKRVFAEKREHIINWQFADLSAVAPFQYHSVRSLGFLVYALCHIQNRMRCKFNEAVFEALMMYFKVKTGDDAQRALKLQLVNRGFIDDSLTPLTANERYQVNTALVELGLASNKELIDTHSAAYTQNVGQSSGGDRKTKYQVMAELNSMTQLISAGLSQAYRYQDFEDREILRRLFIKDSKDPDTKEFQARCLKRGVPEKLMNIDAWETTHERVLGAGNQTLEMGIAEWLMQHREKYDPDSQRQILRKSTFAVTGDQAFANAMVPEQPEISLSVHDAQLAASGLLMGLPQSLKQGVNHQEYAQTLLQTMEIQIQRITQRSNVATQDELAGLQNLAGQTIQGAPIQGNGIAAHIAVLAQNKEEAGLVKQLGDQLGKMMNLVKAFTQRLQEQQKKAQEQQAKNGGQMDPKDAAKVQATLTMAQVKAQNAKESHAQRTAQKQIQFEQKVKQDAIKHQADLQAKDLEAASNININRMKSLDQK